jgi:hypothetical protein
MNTTGVRPVALARSICSCAVAGTCCELSDMILSSLDEVGGSTNPSVR